jgi:sarcosine oxidase subunit beta
MAETFDVIIIGGGIMGCSTAFQLSQRGLKVALLEKENIGSGSTGKSSAIIRQHYSNELTARMALHSLREFQEFDQRVGGESGFVETGFVAVVAAKDYDGLESNVKLQRKVGIKTEMLSPEALNEIMPGLVTDDLVSAAYEPESGHADPNLTVNAYTAAARRNGTKIFLGTAVTGVRLNKDKVVGVDTSKDKFDAPLVLNCAGPWGARVAKMAEVEVPINSCRVQVALFRRPSGYEASHPVIADFIHATYFRDETGGLTLAGWIDPAEADAIVNPDNYQEQLDASFVLEIGEQVIRRYPPIEQGESAGGYSALYAITPDWHPIIDELIPESGFHICAGFSGHGFKLGPAVGIMAADMLTKETSPEFDPRFFRLSRYAENRPVVGKYEYSIAG